MFADFCGIDIPTMINFNYKVNVTSHLEELYAIGSVELVETAYSIPLQKLWFYPHLISS